MHLVNLKVPMQHFLVVELQSRFAHKLYKFEILEYFFFLLFQTLNSG